MKQTVPWATCLLAALTSCAVTPLTNHIAVGDDPFVIGVAEGPDGNTDLFAASAGGGSFIQLTFTRAEESGPRLAPNGKAVAFFRKGPAGSADAWTVVLLDLTSNSERTVVLPSTAGDPERLGWSSDGMRVAIRASGYAMVEAPPSASGIRSVSPDSTAAADLLTRELLGEPPSAMVATCPGGGVCIATRSGEITPLGEGVTGAVRWGADSVGYVVPGGFEVRPLAGGRSRRPVWPGAPRALRGLTYHPGHQLTTSSGASGIR